MVSRFPFSGGGGLACKEEVKKKIIFKWLGEGCPIKMALIFQGKGNKPVQTHSFFKTRIAIMVLFRHEISRYQLIWCQIFTKVLNLLHSTSFTNEFIQRQCFYLKDPPQSIYLLMLFLGGLMFQLFIYLLKNHRFPTSVCFFAGKKKPIWQTGDFCRILYMGNTLFLCSYNSSNFSIHKAPSVTAEHLKFVTII